MMLIITMHTEMLNRQMMQSVVVLFHHQPQLKRQMTQILEVLFHNQPQFKVQLPVRRLVPSKDGHKKT